MEFSKFRIRTTIFTKKTRFLRPKILKIHSICYQPWLSLNLPQIWTRPAFQNYLKILFWIFEFPPPFGQNRFFKDLIDWWIDFPTLLTTHHSSKNYRILKSMDIFDVHNKWEMWKLLVSIVCIVEYIVYVE